MPIGRSVAGQAGAMALRLGAAGSADVTLLRAASGGIVVADVVSTKSGNEAFARKHLDRPRTEDFRLEIGTSLSAGLFDWIRDSWGAKPPTRDGALLACDVAYEVRAERQFERALITETAFPALDAATKSVGVLTITFAPATVTNGKGTGARLAFPTSKASARKLWLPSNFRLDIGGLDCTRVSRIDAFSVRRTVRAAGSGHGGDLQPGAIEFPDLRVTLAASSAETWMAWHEDFVVSGNNGQAFERTGSITLLAPNLKTELARIDLAGVGIFRLTTPGADGDQPGSADRVTANLYCEQMSLVPGGTP